MKKSDALLKKGQEVIATHTEDGVLNTSDAFKKAMISVGKEIRGSKNIFGDVSFDQGVSLTIGPSNAFDVVSVYDPNDGIAIYHNGQPLSL